MSCVFCEKITHDDGVTEVGRLGVFYFEPLNPIVPGHLLFVSREHVENAKISSGLTGLIFTAAATYARGRNEDFNLIVNCGPAATQTVQHLHIHYVPRTMGDGLKLPWTDQVKTTELVQCRVVGGDDYMSLCVNNAPGHEKHYFAKDEDNPAYDYEMKA